MGKPASNFLRGLREDIEGLIRQKMPYRARATTIAGVKVQIQPYGATAPMGQQYERLDGPAIQANDDVVVLIVDDQPIIIGRVLKA